MHENREISCMSWSADQDRSAKAINRTADMHVREKSDCAVVPVNQPNKEVQAYLTLASTPLILNKSRMRKRARTDLCGGRSVMIVPTATVEPEGMSLRFNLRVARQSGLMP